jgi:uncharacterized protein involved in exopolysaccharide biosynthesis
MQSEEIISPRDETINIRDYIRVIVNRKWTILTVFIVLVTTVTIGSFKIMPVFQATSQLLIEKGSPNIVNIQEVLDADTSHIDYYKTQYEMLKSNSLALRVIKILNLKNSTEFKPKNKDSSINIKAKISSWIKKGINVISSQKTRETRITQNNEEKEMNSLIKTYLEKLKITPIRDSRLVNISFEAHDPALAAKIINTHARLYIETNLEGKLNASKDALSWINRQIEGIKVELEKSEEALQKYKENNNLISINFEERYNINIQNLNNLNNALTEAKTRRIGMENLYNEMKRLSKDPQEVESLPAVVENPLIQELKAQHVKLIGGYSDLSEKFGPEHPRMISLKSTISEMESKIAYEIKNIAKSIEIEYKISKAKEKSIAKALSDQKEAALKLNQKEIKYNTLKRYVETNRMLYESLLKRAKETGITENLKATNIVVVDPARIPDNPIKPKKKQNILLAIITGLTLGIGLAFFFEYLDNTIKTPDDIEKHLNLPTLGVIPHKETN